MAATKRKKLLIGVSGAVVVFGLMQAVPYGHSAVNPDVIQEPEWASPEVRDLAVRACFDCHSNQTRYPWYSHVAPVSWLVAHDVEEARHELNFSEFNRPHHWAYETVEELEEGEMPPAIYVMMHGEAKLTDAERQTLIDGFRAMFPEPEE